MVIVQICHCLNLSEAPSSFKNFGTTNKLRICRHQESRDQIRYLRPGGSFGVRYSVDVGVQVDRLVSKVTE